MCVWRIDCADLAHTPLGLKRGGVGYYRASDFVHLEYGRLQKPGG